MQIVHALGVGARMLSAARLDLVASSSSRTAVAAVLLDDGVRAGVDLDHAGAQPQLDVVLGVPALAVVDEGTVAFGLAEEIVLESGGRS